MVLLVVFGVFALFAKLGMLMMGVFGAASTIPLDRKTGVLRRLHAMPTPNSVPLYAGLVVVATVMLVGLGFAIPPTPARRNRRLDTREVHRRDSHVPLGGDEQVGPLGSISSRAIARRASESLPRVAHSTVSSVMTLRSRGERIAAPRSFASRSVRAPCSRQPTWQPLFWRDRT